MYGDLVLADRGFNISEAPACYGATLAIPPFKNENLKCQAERLKQLGNYQGYEFMLNMQLVD